ncbi:hypothetical protein ANCDUO_02294 [Ancylostoma duodenale]|uniref:Uncharacterized protein n=1 Tax=Ancylostoma duodenale TaxID=51022 RepID=A0A0C2HCW1_9BILA|nr:hypothetical protein ANCDUO_02294 [Ancylostoma duodenale]
MEMKMLRWMARVTRLDPISNQDIRNRFGVAAISDKLDLVYDGTATFCVPRKEPSTKSVLISKSPANGQMVDQSNAGLTRSTPILS